MALFKKIEDGYGHDFRDCIAKLQIEAEVVIAGRKPQDGYGFFSQPHSPAILALLREFSVQLNCLLNKYRPKLDAQEMNTPRYKRIAHEFAYECHSLIYSYQPQLMSAPGIWNQLKALINNVLERLEIIHPIFSTSGSTLMADDDFFNRFEKAKNYLKPGETDQENYMIWPMENGNYCC